MRILMDMNLDMIDPTDDGVLEDLAKKSTRPGEEALIFAVLKSATEDFQQYVNARDRKGKLSFRRARRSMESPIPATFGK